jgi:hypothetical protein
LLLDDVVNLGKGSQVGLIKTINKTIINKSSWNSTLGLCIACTASFNNALVNHTAIDGLGGSNCDCEGN